jgi:hypothetical protein
MESVAGKERRGALERPLIYVVTAVATLALIAGGVALVSYIRSPKTVPDKLDSWIHHDAGSCLMKREPVSAASRPDIYPDLLSRADSGVMVACDFGGPFTVVLGFGSRERLERAFAHSRSAAHSGWCIAGDEAFDGRWLDPGELRRFCGRLGGSLRPRATPPAGP